MSRYNIIDYSMQSVIATVLVCQHTKFICSAKIGEMVKYTSIAVYNNV